jgi:hypothetical protein
MPVLAGIDFKLSAETVVQLQIVKEVKKGKIE